MSSSSSSSKDSAGKSSSKGKDPAPSAAAAAAAAAASAADELIARRRSDVGPTVLTQPQLAAKLLEDKATPLPAPYTGASVMGPVKAQLVRMAPVAAVDCIGEYYPIRIDEKNNALVLGRSPNFYTRTSAAQLQFDADQKYYQRRQTELKIALTNSEHAFEKAMSGENAEQEVAEIGVLALEVRKLKAELAKPFASKADATQSQLPDLLSVHHVISVRFNQFYEFGGVSYYAFRTGTNEKLPEAVVEWKAEPSGNVPAFAHFPSSIAG